MTNLNVNEETVVKEKKSKIWSYDSEKGVLTRLYKEDVIPLAIELTDLFENFLELEKVQRLVIVNGIKQKIADVVAGMRDSTEEERREAQETIANRIIYDREFNLPKKGRAGGKKGESVEVKALLGSIAPLYDAGFSAEKISGLLIIPLIKVQEVIDSIEDYEKEE
jgi:hypothetical protein